MPAYTDANGVDYDLTHPVVVLREGGGLFPGAVANVYDEQLQPITVRHADTKDQTSTVTANADGLIMPFLSPVAGGVVNAGSGNFPFFVINFSALREGLKGPRGDKGEDGAPGTGVQILGERTTADDLPSSGTVGDGYLVGSDLYVWTPSSVSWVNVGPIRGPQGDPGPQGNPGPPLNLDSLASTADLPVEGDPGDAYLIGTHLWAWNELAGIFMDLGDISGPKGDKGDKGDRGQEGEPGAPYTGPGFQVIDADAATPPVTDGYILLRRQPPA